MNSSFQHARRSLLILFLAVFVSACSLANPVPTPTPTAEPAPLPTASPSPEPSPTPLAPRVVLLAPPGADPAWVNTLQPVLSAPADQAGLRFQVLPALAPAELADVRAVVVLPPDPGVVALAAAAPDAHFLAVGIPGLTAGANLSVIDASGGSPDQTGFLAGFIAAEITTDWRVGIITESGTAQGASASQGYANGVTYFCGLCLPAYPPFPASGYPIVVELPPSAGPADWQAAVTYLSSWQVETAYIVPTLAQEPLLNDLAQAGIHLILPDSPPADLQESWVASLGSGDVLEPVAEVWGKILQGGEAVYVALPLGISGANPALLSPGRQRLAEEMLGDLMAGLIDTGASLVTPAP